MREAATLQHDPLPRPSTSDLSRESTGGAVVITGVVSEIPMKGIDVGRWLVVLRHEPRPLPPANLTAAPIRRRGRRQRLKPPSVVRT